MHRFMFFRNGDGQAVFGPTVHNFDGVLPRLPGMKFVEIEYIPRLSRWVLWEKDPEHDREMTPLERLIADSALERMYLGVKGVFS